MLDDVCARFKKHFLHYFGEIIAAVPVSTTESCDDPAEASWCDGADGIITGLNGGRTIG